jgi:hypothetical protein
MKILGIKKYENELDLLFSFNNYKKLTNWVNKSWNFAVPLKGAMKIWIRPV